MAINTSIANPVNLPELGFSGDCTVRDLWNKSDLGTFSGLNFAPEIHYHGAGLYRISALNRLTSATIELSGPSEANIGESTILDISVTTNTDTPSGLVMIYKDGIHVGTVEIDNLGTAQFNTSFPEVGTYNFVAKYSGNANYTSKTSS